MSTYCIGWHLQAITGDVRDVGGEACMMAGESTLITKNLSADVKNSLANSAQTSVSEVAIDGARILEFFDAHYGSKTASIQKVAVEDHYIEVFLTDLRGEVIEGKDYWERLQASILVADFGQHIDLRLLLDGQFAAGLNPPPVTGYSDMEPVHAKSLQVYAGQLLAELKQFILSR